MAVAVAVVVAVVVVVAVAVARLTAALLAMAMAAVARARTHGSLLHRCLALPPTLSTLEMAPLKCARPSRPTRRYSGVSRSVKALLWRCLRRGLVRASRVAAPLDRHRPAPTLSLQLCEHQPSRGDAMRRLARQTSDGHWSRV